MAKLIICTFLLVAAALGNAQHWGSNWNSGWNGNSHGLSTVGSYGHGLGATRGWNSGHAYAAPAAHGWAGGLSSYGNGWNRASTYAAPAAHSWAGGLSGHGNGWNSASAYAAPLSSRGGAVQQQVVGLSGGRYY